MTEKRTYTILFAATILSARKLLEMCPTSKTRFFVGYAIDDAAFILEGLNQKWLAKVDSHSP